MERLSGIQHIFLKAWHREWVSLFIAIRIGAEGDPKHRHITISLKLPKPGGKQQLEVMEGGYPKILRCYFF